MIGLHLLGSTSCSLTDSPQVNAGSLAPASYKVDLWTKGCVSDCATSDAVLVCAEVPPYNPVSGNPQQASQARYTPSQSPERASDPLAFLQGPPVTQSQAPRQRTAAAAGRKAVRAAYQPYQPPSEAQWPPPQQQTKVHTLLPESC